MIKAIDEKYCKNDLVQLMPYSSTTQLITSADEILFLKVGDEVLINKYEKHPSRNLFPYSDKIKHSGNYTQLFEYNKQYLNYRGSFSGINIQQNYFFKGSNRALYLSDSLNIDDRNVEYNEQIMDRKNIENIFNSNNYDSMYLVDRNGIVQFAKSKKDGIVIDKKIIPSDKEIVKLEREERLSKHHIACAINDKIDTEEKEKSARKYNSIDDIHNFKIYGPFLTANYSHILITSKDGVINATWFKLEFVKKDVFKITTSPIPVIEPTIDDVINYSSNHTIAKTNDPEEDEESKFSEAVSRILDLKSDVKIKKIDYHA